MDAELQRLRAAVDAHRIILNALLMQATDEQLNSIISTLLQEMLQQAVMGELLAYVREID